MTGTTPDVPDEGEESPSELESWGERVRTRKALTGGKLDADRVLEHRDADRRG